MYPELQDIARQIIEAAAGRRRYIVALAGPPGSGKSYRSELLCDAIAALRPGDAVVVPMDGYHFDNAVLEPSGELPVKGAPHTFDADGLRVDLERIRRGDRDVAVPVFDRPLDLARAGGRLISRDHSIVLVEGNYLLLDEAPWRELHGLFDLTILLDVDDEVLEQRLFERWLDMGQEPASALDKARHKDMLNARLVKSRSISPDLVWR
ncbi:nucleoside/nucleotide kinase family protein [Billgrantia montanilacus]|uniref:Nucleoside/nucleotide kinase family protein n=1 Tax=Billgrantia montanilacus TaxID=2282305 RepID=A0A368TZB1_9GAMM|nr:nucleoside/nucleotide kinase family protein [Halomonas montanilacus]RCV89676.1 nucleoside/nucleotide kinase family protein [Halomonas montanilacus]